MYAAVVLCVLVAAVSMSGVPSLVKLGKQQPDKCCAPAVFTYDIYGVSLRASNGALFSSRVRAQAAYDSLGMRVGLKLVDDFSNGTVEDARIIVNYDTEVLYIIISAAGVKTCTKLEITGPFPYQCVPDESTFLGYKTVGNRALKTGVWHYSDKIEAEKNEATFFTVQHPDCVFISALTRVYDPATDAEISDDDNTFTNFNLGISDPDKWFKPPAECENATMMNTVHEKVVGLRGPNGKLMFE